MTIQTNVIVLTNYIVEETCSENMPYKILSPAARRTLTHRFKKEVAKETKRIFQRVPQFFLEHRGRLLNNNEKTMSMYGIHSHPIVTMHMRACGGAVLDNKCLNIADDLDCWSLCESKLTCTLCDSEFSRQDRASLHQKGQEHQKHVRREKAWMVMIAFTGEEHVWAMDLLKCVCLLCNKTFTKSELSYLEAHRESAHHKKMVGQEDAWRAVMTTLDTEKHVWGQGPMEIECFLCSKTFNKLELTSLENHRQSVSHKKLMAYDLWLQRRYL